MAIRTKVDYSGEYLTPTGTWPDNSAGEITPQDLRNGIADNLDTMYEMPSGIYGDLSNGNYSEFQKDTGFQRSYGSGVGWDDIKFPFIGQKIDISAGKIDYNYDENTVDFATNADSTDTVHMIVQMNHDWESDSLVSPHIHWIQQESGIPAWRMNYRHYPNGGQVPPWTTGVQPKTEEVFPYTTGNMLQITSFPDISGSAVSGYGVSWFLDVKIYRDSSSDSYSIAAQSKEFDVHYRRNDKGSREEFVK